MQSHSDVVFEYLTAIVLVLVGVTFVWYLLIFENPQIEVNPFKPPTPVVVAGLLPPAEIPTLAADATQTGTATATLTAAPSATSTSTATATASPSATPSSVITPLFPIVTPSKTLAPSNAPVSPPADGKWIDVDIGEQTITAYMGHTALKTVLVSTGVASHPTVIGQYKIYVKVPSQSMRGGSKFSHDYYYLPGVPSVMFFFDGYAIHGTYWHNNFGHPMSHGCVNLSLEDAKWFFGWAEVGTIVVTHL